MAMRKDSLYYYILKENFTVEEVKAICDCLNEYRQSMIDDCCGFEDELEAIEDKIELLDSIVDRLTEIISSPDKDDQEKIVSVMKYLSLYQYKYKGLKSIKFKMK